MSNIPKSIPQEVIDHIYELGFTEGQKCTSISMYQRAWKSGLRQAIRLRPRYYRPHHEDINSILDPYFKKLNEAVNKPPKPHNPAPSPEVTPS